MSEEREEEQLIPVEEGTEPDELPEEDLEDEDEDVDSEEGRLGASEEDDEDEKRERRREERKERNRRRKEARDRNQRELNFLRTRNEELERRQSEIEARVGQNEVANIDSRINQAKRNLATANEVMQKALEQGKHADFIEAQNLRDKVRDDLGKLTNYKDYYTRQSRQPAPRQEVDPQLMNYAQNWATKNSWWNPNGQDEDSLIVSAIDNSLAQEAYDPRTSEYWDELQRRVEERLPHRFESEKPQRKKSPQSKGPQFRTNGRERPLKKNEIFISAERKEAMQEAGVWDDPQLRDKYLKQYQKYDREHRS